MKSFKPFFLLLLCIQLSACAVSADNNAPSAALPTPVIIPDMPAGIELADNGTPVLDVYVVSDNMLERMPV